MSKKHNSLVRMAVLRMVGIAANVKIVTTTHCVYYLIIISSEKSCELQTAIEQLIFFYKMLFHFKPISIKYVWYFIHFIFFSNLNMQNIQNFCILFFQCNKMNLTLSISSETLLYILLTKQVCFIFIYLRYLDQQSYQINL